MGLPLTPTLSPAGRGSEDTPHPPFGHLLPQGEKAGRSAIANAMWRARAGLDWSYPCLIWVMDYVAEATGRDPAAGWRHLSWDEATARRELGRAAVPGTGETAVERALDAAAKREGWIEADGPRQGAVMIGVYDGVEAARHSSAAFMASSAEIAPLEQSPSRVGVPAIFDGQDRWIVSNTGRGVTSLAEAPQRIWEIAG